MISDKGRTNRNWTSTEEYRSAWDRIFGKKEVSEKEGPGGELEAEEVHGEAEAGLGDSEKPGGSSPKA